MKQIELSKIPNWMSMNVNELTNYCLDNDIDTVVNDYATPSIEYALDDMTVMLPRFIEYFTHLLKKK